MTRMRARAAGLTLLVLLTLPAADAGAAFPSGAKVERGRSGHVTFVGSAPGKPLARPAGHTASSSPAAAGKAFLEGRGREFGLGRRASLRAVGSTRQAKGARAVRYQQSIDGVDVLGGEFVVQLDAQNRILSVLGEAQDGEVPTEPRVTAAQAEVEAIAAVAKAEGVHAARLRTSETGLRIFNDALLGGPRGDTPRLVWATTVGDGDAVRKLVLVEASRGYVVTAIERNPEAKNRTVCDGNNVRGAQAVCTTPVIGEGGSTAGHNADVVAAYDYTGKVYDYLQERFGRDSLDGAGMALKSTVRFCSTNLDEACPFQNAFWNGQQMTYGQGFAVADDVVAHELAHGLTEFTSNLLYYFQSGAINESMSDVFGELIDQATPEATDLPEDRWIIGERLATIRNMADPTALGDPDRVGSANWFVDLTEEDSGGVHYNSGVGNKAAYLMTDGGSFNGETVTGLGAGKVIQIYYAVQTGFLTSGSDYEALGLALGQACDNLVGEHGITPADCVEVRDAVDATEMLEDRPETPDAAECLAGQLPSYLLFDEIAGNAAGWETFTSVAGKTWVLDDNFYATSGRYSLWGRDFDSAVDYTLRQDTSRTIPANAFLRFSHAYDFEAGFDGGVVEVSTDAGASWSEAVPVPDRAVFYPATLSTVTALNGRRAFSGKSAGYRTSVISLAALSGQSARFRFRVATDSAVGGSGFLDGWEVDDVGIFTCSAAELPAAVTGAASALTTTTATVAGTADPNGLNTEFFVEYGAGGSLDQVTEAEEVPGTGTDPVAVQTTLTGLSPATEYGYRIVARSAAGEHRGATRTFTTAEVVDTTTAPAAVTGDASAVTAGAATLAGTVDPNGLATTYVFHYGTGGSLTASSAPASAGAGTEPAAVSATLSGLAANTQYSYRLVAQNSKGEVLGEIRTFTTAATGTAPVPPGDPASPPPSGPFPPSPSVPGPAGPAGGFPAALKGTARPTRKRVKSARVTCANAATRLTCKVTFPGARRKRKVSATLKRGSTTVARGTARKAGAKGLVTIRGRKGIHTGTYALAVKVGRTTYRFRLTLG